MIASKKDNKNGTLLTYSQMAEDSNLSLNTVKKLAKESGSIIRLGERLVRIDKEKFYEYLRANYGENNDD